MKKLKDVAQRAEKNSPEFIKDLEEMVVKPMVSQGCTFAGWSAQANDKEESGFYLFIFNNPGSKEIEIPYYQDEGTDSRHYDWYGTIYILIPMPY